MVAATLEDCILSIKFQRSYQIPTVLLPPGDNFWRQDTWLSQGSDSFYEFRVQSSLTQRLRVWMMDDGESAA